MFGSATSLLPSPRESNKNSSSSTQNIDLFDHLVLYRFYLNNDKSSNSSSVDDATYIWWPALLFDSHHAALSRFAQNPACLLLEHRRFCLNLLREIKGPAVPVVELLGFRNGGGRWKHPVQEPKQARATASTTTTNQDIQPLNITGALYLRQQDAKQHAAAFEQATRQVSEILSQSPHKTSTPSATSQNSASNQHHHHKLASDEQHEQQKNQRDDGYDNDYTLDRSDNQDRQLQQGTNDDDGDDADNAVLEDPCILANDNWEVVWDKLQWTGWVLYHDHTSRQDLYRIPPTVDHLFPKTSYTLEEIQEFCQTKYGWEGPPLPRHHPLHDGRSVVSASNTTLTTVASTLTPNRPTRPQDPGAPLSSSSDESSAVSDPYQWSYLWPRLQKDRWTITTASNPLHNWYYCAPGVNKNNGELGKTMFRTEAEVIRHVQRQHGHHSAASDLEESNSPRRRKRGRSVARRLSLDSIPIHTSKKQKKSQSSRPQKKEERSQSTSRKRPQQRHASSSSEKRSSTSKTTVRRTSAKKKTASSVKKTAKHSATNTAAVKAVVSTTKKKKSKKIGKSHHRPNTAAMPAVSDIQPILEKLGIQRTDSGAYSLPIRGGLHFVSSRGLGIFFLQAGVPNISKLTKTEAKRLTQWARFVNVPAAASTLAPDAIQRLAENLSMKQLFGLLRDLAFEVSMGYIFLPHCPANRQHGIHFFAESAWNTEFRKCIQSRWCLALPLPDDTAKQQAEDPYNNGWTTKQQEAALTLRWWAALYDDQPLDELHDFPKPRRRGDPVVDVALLQKLPEMQPVSFSFVKNQAIEDHEEDSPGPVVQQNDTTANNSSSSNDNHSVTLVTPVPQRKQKGDNRPWYERDVPDFSVVWPILQNKMRWTQTSSGHFQHPSVPNRIFTTTTEIRRYVATTKIRDIDRSEFSGDDKRILNRWAMTVNLDQCFAFEGFATIQRPNKYQAHAILHDLGFKPLEGKFCLIHADRFRLTRRSLTLDEVLVFMLTRENWSVDPNQPFGPKDYGTKITDVKMMQLLRFALEEVKPCLPSLVTPKKPRSKRRGCMSTLDTPHEDETAARESDKIPEGASLDEDLQHNDNGASVEKQEIEATATVGEAPLVVDHAEETTDLGASGTGCDTDLREEPPSYYTDEVADSSLQEDVASDARTDIDGGTGTADEDNMDFPNEYTVEPKRRNVEELVDAGELFVVEEHHQENGECASFELQTQVQETIGGSRDNAMCKHNDGDESSLALKDCLKETYQMIEEMAIPDLPGDFLTQDP